MGGDWSPLEIIIVLILVIAILGRVFGLGINKKVPDVATYKDKQETVTPAFNDCGKVLVTTPKPLQKVTTGMSYVLVQGTIKNCDTIAVAPDSLSIVVVDGSGAPLSSTTTLPVVVNKNSVSFSDTVAFTAVPRTGTGYVIITRISNTGTQRAEEGARIPIRFVNQ